MFHVRALNLNHKITQHLGFLGGAVIECSEDVEVYNGWAKGKYNGHSCLFPLEDVELLSRAEALCDFAAPTVDDLGFTAGDLITITEGGSSPQWKGLLRGAAGRFPAKYVLERPHPPSVSALWKSLPSRTFRRRYGRRTELSSQANAKSLLTHENFGPPSASQSSHYSGIGYRAESTSQLVHAPAGFRADSTTQPTYTVPGFRADSTTQPIYNIPGFRTNSITQPTYAIAGFRADSTTQPTQAVARFRAESTRQSGHTQADPHVDLMKPPEDHTNNWSSDATMYPFEFIDVTSLASAKVPLPDAVDNDDELSAIIADLNYTHLFLQPITSPEMIYKLYSEANLEKAAQIVRGAFGEAALEGVRTRLPPVSWQYLRLTLGELDSITECFDEIVFLRQQEAKAHADGPTPLDAFPNSLFRTGKQYGEFLIASTKTMTILFDLGIEIERNVAVFQQKLRADYVRRWGRD